MLKLLLFILILLVITVLTYFILRFTVVRIDGESMSPTFHNGNFVFADRYFSPKYSLTFGEKVKSGQIFIYYSPNGYIVIKRLDHVIKISDAEYLYWFEGDNKAGSRDSREYGYIHEENIIAEVISFGTFIKRIFLH